MVHILKWMGGEHWLPLLRGMSMKTDFLCSSVFEVCYPQEVLACLHPSLKDSSCSEERWRNLNPFNWKGFFDSRPMRYGLSYWGISHQLEVKSRPRNIIIIYYYININYYSAGVEFSIWMNSCCQCCSLCCANESAAPHKHTHTLNFIQSAFQSVDRQLSSHTCNLHGDRLPLGHLMFVWQAFIFSHVGRPHRRFSCLCLAKAL